MSSRAIEQEARLIEKIVSRRKEILSEAERRAEEIIREAREQVNKILEEARETQRAQARRIIGTELRSTRDRVLGGAEQEGRRKLMEARGEVISRVFREVEDRLRAIAEGRDESVDYHEVLFKLILEAASAIGERELVIAVNKGDRGYLIGEMREIDEAVSKALGYEVRLIVEEEPIDCLGGAILYDRSKRKIFYNTLEGRLLRTRSEMEAEVAKILGVI